MLPITLKAGNLQDFWPQIANSVTAGGKKKNIGIHGIQLTKFTQIHAKPTQLHKNKQAWQWGEGHFRSSFMIHITLSNNYRIITLSNNKCLRFQV